ncbi:MAG: thiamine phosphate synthase [Deltaproteobacteria bacterium]|nr:MAG: thiamine phosphate synthase [Deltaproteobacteria bacterium]
MSARTEIWSRIHGLYGLADAEAAVDGDPVRLGRQLLDGGCRLIQLRAKGWGDQEIARAARELLPLCRSVGATFILNDSPGLAADVDADGVHIGQTDGDLDEARRLLGPDRILGRSTHDPAHVREALAHADYLAFGPVFDTPHLSRPKQVRGIALLAQAAAQVDGAMPLVAIGGITAPRLPAVRAAGAHAWAVIGAIAKAEDPISATRALLA